MPLGDYFGCKIFFTKCVVEAFNWAVLKLQLQIFAIGADGEHY
jgi:hypothetical protein